MTKINVRVDGSRTFQVFDGFGANLNPVGHWKQGAGAQAVDQLVDDMGGSLFRLDPFGFCTWPDPDGTLGPASLELEHLEELYSSESFREAWEMARYLQSKGARILLNVSGIVPEWMCEEDGITLKDVASYVEMLASLVVWAREREGIDFAYFGPLNETDIGPPEGPFASPQVAVTVVEQLSDRLRDRGHGDVKFAVADQARYGLDYFAAFAESGVARDAIGVATVHCYEDNGMSEVAELLERESVGWRYWLTEYGDLEDRGEQEWGVAIRSTRRLLRGILDGIQAGLVWDGYDNYHGHDQCWTLYGLLRTGLRCYTPKKRFYAAAQVHRHVRPGDVRIEATADSEDVMVIASRDLHGSRAVLVGLYTGSEAATVSLHASQPASHAGRVSLFVTNEVMDHELVWDGAMDDHITFRLPGECIFSVVMS